jgi:polyisoprenoid-binding protein YceI
MKRLLAVLLLAASATAAAAERAVQYGNSEIAFTVTQMGVNVDGRFARFKARLDLDAAKPELSTAEIEVDISSISTGDDEADTEALKKPWLDAAGFPKAHFRSTAIRALGAGKYEATGLLTLKGKPRELKIPFQLKDNPDGSVTVSGGFNIVRTDFGIGGGEWNKDDVVANEVPVRFRLVLVAGR